MTHFSTIIDTTKSLKNTSTMKTFCLLFALMVASSAAFAPNLFGVHTQASRYVNNFSEGLSAEATNPMVFYLMVHFQVTYEADRPLL
jgi:phosphoglycerol transferase MdoB-like AlkP superfamily enzyme